MKCSQVFCGQSLLFGLSSAESCFSSWPQHKAIAVPFLSFHLLGHEHPVATNCSQASKVAGDSLCTLFPCYHQMVPCLAPDISSGHSCGTLALQCCQECFGQHLPRLSLARIVGQCLLRGRRMKRSCLCLFALCGHPVLWAWQEPLTQQVWVGISSWRCTFPPASSPLALWELLAFLVKLMLKNLNDSMILSAWTCYLLASKHKK